MTELLEFVNVAPPNRPLARVQVYGLAGRRGVMTIQEEFGVSEKIRLTPTAFAVVRALAEKLAQDASLPEWAPRGFLSTDDLEQWLIDWKLRRLSPHYATKHVYRARRQLAKQIGKVGDLDGRTWSRELLEFNADFKAYRLSVMPEHLYVYPAPPQR
jgi:hypothetical protein